MRHFYKTKKIRTGLRLLRSDTRGQRPCGRVPGGEAPRGWPCKSAADTFARENGGARDPWRPASRPGPAKRGPTHSTDSGDKDAAEEQRAVRMESAGTHRTVGILIPGHDVQVTDSDSAVLV